MSGGGREARLGGNLFLWKLKSMEKQREREGVDNGVAVGLAAWTGE